MGEKVYHSKIINLNLRKVEDYDFYIKNNPPETICINDKNHLFEDINIQKLTKNE